MGRSRRDGADDGFEECPHDCRDGHLPECECSEPAWDIGDLVCRPACSGCCPVHRPAGLAAEAAEAATRVKGLFR